MTQKVVNKKEKKVYTKSVKETPFKHKWLAVSLKAHSDKVTGIDFSSNGKYFLSSGLGNFQSQKYSDKIN